MVKINVFLLLIVLIFIAGCAEMDMPTPVEIIKKPLGTDAVKIGMSKNQVSDIWGSPSETSYDQIEEGGLTRTREVWIYKGRLSLIPVDAGYLSKTKYLYFDGNSLTNISDVDLSKTDTK